MFAQAHHKILLIYPVFNDSPSLLPSGHRVQSSNQQTNLMGFRNMIPGMACFLDIRNIEYTGSIYWQAQSYGRSRLPVDYCCQYILCQCQALQMRGLWQYFEHNTRLHVCHLPHFVRNPEIPPFSCCPCFVQTRTMLSHYYHARRVEKLSHTGSLRATADRLDFGVDYVKRAVSSYEQQWEGTRRLFPR